MWYCFMLNGQVEIIMLSLKQIKVGRVNEIILGKHPEAADIRVATNEEVKAVIIRVKEEELQREIDSRCPCFAKPLSECNCEREEKDPFYTKKLLRDAVVVELPKERPIIPLKPSSFA